MALRIVQDYVVYPRLIRHGMHLSTLAVILTVWTGAVLAGAAGVIIAIPVAGCLSVSLRHWREYPGDRTAGRGGEVGIFSSGCLSNKQEDRRSGGTIVSAGLLRSTTEQS